MKIIGGLLERYKNLKLAEETRKKLIIQLIEDICGLMIEPKQIIIKEWYVYIKGSPSERSAVMLYKKKLTEAIREALRAPKIELM